MYKMDEIIMANPMLPSTPTLMNTAIKFEWHGQLISGLFSNKQFMEESSYVQRVTKYNVGDIIEYQNHDGTDHYNYLIEDVCYNTSYMMWEYRYRILNNNTTYAGFVAEIDDIASLHKVA